jgi:hypothetical protein
MLWRPPYNSVRSTWVVCPLARVGRSGRSTAPVESILEVIRLRRYESAVASCFVFP